MSHEHPVFDSGNIFTIDPSTRSITTEAKDLVLVQFDHNSCRYNFKIPRFINEHDMSLCNLVQVHYQNEFANKLKVSSDIYTVTDIAVSADDEETVTFSWLISNSATQHIGTLGFSICFQCISEDGTIEYEWHTSIFSEVAVIKTVHNTETIIKDNSDFITRIEALVDKMAQEHEETLAKIPTKLSDLNNDLVFDTILLVDSSTSKQYELILTDGKLILQEKEVSA